MMETNIFSYSQNVLKILLHKDDENTLLAVKVWSYFQ